MTKKYHILAYYVCAATLFYTNSWCVTEIYNMRVSTVASARIELNEKVGATNIPGIFISKVLARIRTNKRGDDQLLIADICNLIYSYKNLYARVDGAFGYVRERLRFATTRHTQTDDVLLSAGYIHDISPRTSLTYTLVGGIPTHKDNSLQFFQFGTGHYAIGGQIDGIFKNNSYSWITALRAVHFFESNAQVSRQDVGLASVELGLGNLTDIILSWFKTINNNHSIEIGCNPTFLTNVSTKPTLSPALPSYGIRSSWYATYRYALATGKHPMALGVSASYGLDIAPSIDLASNRNLSFWVSYMIKF